MSDGQDSTTKYGSLQTERSGLAQPEMHENEKQTQTYWPKRDRCCFLIWLCCCCCRIPVRSHKVAPDIETIVVESGDGKATQAGSSSLSEGVALTKSVKLVIALAWLLIFVVTTATVSVIAVGAPLSPENQKYGLQLFLFFLYVLNCDMQVL